MGYACPDSNQGQCDLQYYGFYNQVYRAAWQFKRYSTPDVFGGYWAGQTRQILYNPNPACGSKLVTIANRATAALYAYTPYTPTAAALAAYPAAATGADAACGSYGNRNFWFTYNSWFGSSQNSGAADIANAYALAGGAAGVLGEALAPLNCPASATVCSQEFENGIIVWSRWAGAIITTGPIAEYYRARGGLSSVLGTPTQPITDVTEPGNGDGQAQVFSGGIVHSSSNGTFLVAAPMMPAYSAAGWVRGSFGWPAADEVCSTGGDCVQEFDGGTLYKTSASGTGFAMTGAIGELFRTTGGVTGPLGFPMLPITQVIEPTNGNGQAQQFRNGTVHESAAGTFLVPASLMPAYSAAGWVRGSLGWPAADPVCAPANDCLQEFERGTLFKPKQSSTGFVIGGNIEQLYHSLGGPGGQLGFPLSAATNVIEPVNGNGQAQSFENGIIHSSSSGAFSISTEMMRAYSPAGWVRGSLGWPTAQEQCSGTDYCSQRFQRGAIFRSTANGSVFVVSGQIGVAYETSGGPAGPIGLPTGTATAVTDRVNGNGFAQVFQSGIVHSSSAGTFLVSNLMMPSYSAAGWVRGSLGWPAGAEVCQPSGDCSQEFVGGTLVKPASGPAYRTFSVTNPQIKTFYESLGGASGSLGLAVGQVTVVTDAVNGNGFAQVFQSGIVHSSSAGTFLVSNLMMPSYSAAGWVRGSLGWPAGAEVCSAGTCIQPFVKGTLQVAQ